MRYSPYLHLHWPWWRSRQRVSKWTNERERCRAQQQGKTYGASERLTGVNEWVSRASKRASGPVHTYQFQGCYEWQCIRVRVLLMLFLSSWERGFCFQNKCISFEWFLPTVQRRDALVGVEVGWPRVTSGYISLAHHWWETDEEMQGLAWFFSREFTITISLLFSSLVNRSAIGKPATHNVRIHKSFKQKETHIPHLILPV